MQLPPPHVVRDGPPPDDLLLVVRGGRTSLDDINLGRSTADTWDQYGFFGVSVFGAADDDLVALSGDEPAIRRRAEVRVARVGHLRRHGFEVVATFTNRRHFSIVLPDASVVTFDLVRACFSAAQANPGYQPDR
jgi:hypothetical protein